MEGGFQESLEGGWGRCPDGIRVQRVQRSLRVEADVEENRGILRAMPGLTITERELAILAVAVTEMQRDGHRPFTDKFPIQVATCLVCGVGRN